MCSGGDPAEMELCLMLAKKFRYRFRHVLYNSRNINKKIADLTE